MNTQPQSTTTTSCSMPLSGQTNQYDIKAKLEIELLEKTTENIEHLYGRLLCAKKNLRAKICVGKSDKISLLFEKYASICRMYFEFKNKMLPIAKDECFKGSFDLSVLNTFEMRWNMLLPLFESFLAKLSKVVENVKSGEDALKTVKLNKKLESALKKESFFASSQTVHKEFSTYIYSFMMFVVAVIDSCCDYEGRGKIASDLEAKYSVQFSSSQL